MSGFSGASKPVNFLSFFIFSCVNEPPCQYSGHHHGLRLSRQAAEPLDVLSLVIVCHFDFLKLRGGLGAGLGRQAIFCGAVLGHGVAWGSYFSSCGRIPNLLPNKLFPAHLSLPVLSSENILQLLRVLPGRISRNFCSSLQGGIFE